MKLHKLIMALILMTGIVMTETGCLKDKLYDSGTIQSEHATGPQPKVVEVRLTASSNANFLVLSLENSSTDTTMDLVPIDLATPGPATQDIHVTVALDSSLVDAFDTANGTDYAMPPSSMYTIVNPVVTIPKGSHIGYVQIKFKVSDFLGGSWALGFQITGIQESGYTVSGNLNTGIVSIGVKNQYDGIYANTCAIYKSGALLTTTNGNVTLATKSSNTVTTTTLGNYFSPYDCEFTINPDNSVTVSSADFQVTNIGPNTFDPSTKTIQVSFSILSGKYVFNQTLVYKGPR